MKAKCQKCNYEWDSNSPMIMVSCPSCGNKVKIRDIEDVFINKKNKPVGKGVGK